MRTEDSKDDKNRVLIFLCNNPSPYRTFKSLFFRFSPFFSRFCLQQPNLAIQIKLPLWVSRHSIDLLLQYLELDKFDEQVSVLSAHKLLLLADLLTLKHLSRLLIHDYILPHAARTDLCTLIKTTDFRLKKP